MRKKLFLILVVFTTITTFSQTGWLPVTGFGTNPGSLNMYSYVPTGISAKAPLVLVMHGCTQNATTYAAQSGWNKLADGHKFYVVYPEQNTSNNSNTCFNWFLSGDQNRGQGEAFSIKQMIDYMKTHYTIDTTKIFVTGLSAGACMTNVMMACYPDIFNKGAVMAGVPYKAGSNALYGFITNTPQAWADSVKTAFPSYSGVYPKVSVFQGSSDFVVSPNNVPEIVKQWTYLNGADQTADVVVNSFNGNAAVTKNIFNDNNGNEVVETFTITGMSHGIAVDTGTCYQKGGQTGTYALETARFHSTFWAAYFFDILIPPYTITGIQTVPANQTGVTYSVTNTSGSTYNWTVPTGATIVSGQGTNLITVNFGTQSGYVEVTETQSGNCKNGPVKIFVTVTGGSGIANFSTEEIKILQTGGHSFVIKANKEKQCKVKIYNTLGAIVFEDDVFSNTTVLLNLNRGVYIAEVKNENSAQIKKLFVLD